MNEAKELIRRHIQNQHELCVWECLREDVEGWKNRTLNDHAHQRLARDMGVEIVPPGFLDRLIEAIQACKPGTDTPDSTEPPRRLPLQIVYKPYEGLNTSYCIEINHAKCSVCDRTRPCLESDGSGDEYYNGSICQDCANAAFNQYLNPDR